MLHRRREEMKKYQQQQQLLCEAKHSGVTLQKHYITKNDFFSIFLLGMTLFLVFINMYTLNRHSLIMFICINTENENNINLKNNGKN